MSAITGAFTLARALNMALLVEWASFFDWDGDHNADPRDQTVPLNEHFYPPCFRWDLSLAHLSIRDYAAPLIDLRFNGNDANFDAIINGNITSWQSHKVVRISGWADFTPLVLINPAFDAVARSFPRNYNASARGPQIPSPSTLMIRYLFTPNTTAYSINVRTEFQRLKDEVRQKCDGSRYYGLHLRLRSEFAPSEKAYFPCLEKLLAFTGEKCYFVARDSEKSLTTIRPYLPQNAIYLFYNITIERNTVQGLQAAIIELYILGSSFMVFGFAHSTYASSAATIQGRPISEEHCRVSESSVKSMLCNVPNLVRKAVVKVINNVTEDAFDQRKRLGCLLLDKFPPNDPDNIHNYKLKKLPVRSACIVYVLTNISNIDSLLVSIKSLEVNLFVPISQKYRIIVFTQNISKDQLKPLLDVREKMDIALAELGPWILPLNLSTDSLKGKDDASINRSHLNRFLSGPLFERPELKGYDYIMRLNTASSLCSPVAEDPIQRMVNHGLNYASARHHVDLNLSMKGLDGLTRTFLHDTGIRPVNIHHSLNPAGQLMPIRHLDSYEVIRSEFFLHSNYDDYFEVLDAALGFYTQEWDEGIIKHLGLALFAHPGSVGDFTSILQCHESCPK
jgi:Glycolipid 2-alpha-mannosyltransferase